MTSRLIAAFGLSALWVSSSAFAQAPSVSIPEHPYPPGSKTVLTIYTCKDGARSIALQTGQFAKARVASLVRNGFAAPPAVIDRVNAALASLDSVTAIHPECGAQADVMIVEGRKGKERSQLLIGWSRTQALR